MNYKIVLLALSVGVGLGLSSCRKQQTATAPSPLPIATSSDSAGVTAVSDTALAACKAEIAKIAAQSQGRFRIYDYQPQADGTSLLFWRISDREAGTCKVDQDGKVLQIGNGEDAETVSSSASPEPTQSGGSKPPRSAVLATKTPGSQVNVRAKPTTTATSAYSGVDGDRVQILDETQGNDGFTWYYVKFDGSAVEGWVRSDLVDLSSASTNSRIASELPAEVLNGCKTRAAQEFNTTAADIEIARSRADDAGGYQVSVRAKGNGASANCQTNRSGAVTAWEPQSTDRKAVGETPATMCDPQKQPC